MKHLVLFYLNKLDGIQVAFVESDTACTRGVKRWVFILVLISQKTSLIYF